MWWKIVLLRQPTEIYGLSNYSLYFHPYHHLWKLPQIHHLTMISLRQLVITIKKKTYSLGSLVLSVQTRFYVTQKTHHHHHLQSHHEHVHCWWSHLSYLLQSLFAQCYYHSGVPTAVKRNKTTFMYTDIKKSWALPSMCHRYHNKASLKLHLLIQSFI